MTVVTGLSGSGKSSLVFDTLYAEGQRRYVETFSPYARQFLERLDQPRVDAIENIPPAIAIQQGNTVKTSRSTVGTLTELCDYFKLLMPHRAKLFCPQCGQQVVEDTAEGIFQKFAADGGAVMVCFPVTIPDRMTFKEVGDLLIQQGYQRWWNGREAAELAAVNLKSRIQDPESRILIVQDRIALSAAQKSRFIEAIEAAFRAGKGRLSVVTVADARDHRFSQQRHCAHCDRSFPAPASSLFSFNLKKA